MKRLLKNTFWYLIISLLAIAYYEYAPFQGYDLWLYFPLFCAIEYIAISKLREKLRF